MQPSKELRQQVRAGFIKQGISLQSYCLDSDIDSSNAAKALAGKWKGTKAVVLVNSLIEASKAGIEKIEDTQDNEKVGT